jgi:predicted outer membrane protein
MIADHTKTSSDLKSIISSGDLKVEIPSGLDSSSQSKLNKLRDAKPEEFAAQYDPMQVSAHKDAVSLFERYAKGGDNPKLKDWAGKTLMANAAADTKEFVAEIIDDGKLSEEAKAQRREAPQCNRALQPW